MKHAVYSVMILLQLVCYQ